MTADTPVKCSGSFVPPVFDTVLTSTHLISGIWATTQPDKAFGGSTVRTAVIAADFSLAAIHLLSAVYGYSSASSCRDAKALEIDFEGARTPIKATLAAESEAREKAGAIVDARHREVLWAAWLAGHEATACPDALRLLTSDSGCTGAACRAPLLFSSGYQQSCPIDSDARISLYRMVRRRREAAGATTSPCLEETFRALEEPAKATTLPERCSAREKRRQRSATRYDDARRSPTRQHPARTNEHRPAARWC